ncbi:serine/threonine-protein kinase [Alienimonas sp. DA493]|uniref:serine/threonine-protein kinase n=1 Tax=Alienimonas sp. DA493 TaxID=3373605 RepID=UPI003755191F
MSDPDLPSTDPDPPENAPPKLPPRAAGATPAPDPSQTVFRPSGSGKTPPREKAPDRPPPEYIGEFHILRKLGRGGMAEVYLAQQKGLNRQVALKVLRSDKLDEDDTTMIRRFEQEALAAAALNHPNIVQVHSVGEVDGAGPNDGPLHYIAQEYVSGPTLREYLKRKGPPGGKIAIRLLSEIAAALAAAADAGIVHRDIKPENILLTKKGHAKVADFGLARLADKGEGSVTLTQEGMTLGTPLYMSPEQVRGEKLDARSDLYSLGVTAYHLLAGGPPFRGENPMAIAMKHLSATPRPLAELRPDLPPALCEIVHKLMARSPDGRYADAQALGDDLAALAAALEKNPASAQKLKLARLTAAPAPSGKPFGVDQFFQWSLRRHLTFLIPLCLLVGLIGAGIGWAQRPADPFLTPPPAPVGVKLPDADQQFAAALLEDSELGWLALLEHYGDVPAVAVRARDGLAKWYLDHDRPGEARRQADKLTAAASVSLSGSQQLRYKANAEAVRALADLREGDEAEFRRRIAAFTASPQREAVDPGLSMRLRDTIQAYGGLFDDNVRTRWETPESAAEAPTD